MSGMDDLVTWLRQQLDDDERTARACSGNGEWDARDIAIYGPELAPEVRAHMARHDPAHVLARIAADRSIMAIHNRRADVFPGDAGGTFDNCCHGCGYEGICDDPVIEDINDCPVLRALALPYADRPGYLEEWRPGVTHE